MKPTPALTLLAALILLGLSACSKDDLDRDGWTTEDGDCNDRNPNYHPEADEVCNGMDDDCDGLADEEVLITWYPDSDGDGYGIEFGTELSCTQPEGYVARAGDCSDDLPEVNPKAEEVCNELDDDCDGESDEGVIITWYPDSDGDGYGTEADTLADCWQPDGYALARGDCADDDPTIHPGAEDPTENDEGAARKASATDPVAPIDSDCGGTEGPDPHVGISSLSYSTLQAALEAAQDGQTIWVGPGTYHEAGLTMSGKAIGLRSTHGATKTIVKGMGLGTVMYFVDGEDENSVLDGFTLTGGEASENCRPDVSCNQPRMGGGVFMDGSSPSLRQLIVDENSSSNHGGGMYLWDSSPSLTRITLRGNSAEDNGGGIYLNNSSPSLSEVTLSENTSNDYGGGMYLNGSSPALSQLTLSENRASDDGGGMYLKDSNPTLDQATLSGNRAYFNDGGGMYLKDSSPSLNQVTLSDNTAASYGGGMYLLGSSPSLNQVSLSRNTTTGSGGGMFLEDSSPTLTQVSLRGNVASRYGGGMLLYRSSPFLRQTILSGNISSKLGGGMYLQSSSATLLQATVVGNTASVLGGGIYHDGDSSLTLTGVILAFNNNTDLWGHSSQVLLSHCNLFTAFGSSHNITNLNDTNLEVDPRFVAFSDDGDPTNDDLYLRPSSPLIDAGSPDMDGDGADWQVDEDDRDPDGTRADMGVYAGPEADWSGYADGDGDGIYDGWESANGLDPTQDDGGDDLDGDGATNLQEFEAGTDPQGTDSDGDGYSDGAELEAGSDALNPCGIPGVDGLVTLRVPEEYATIQEAVDAVVSSCRIEVSPGTYLGTLWIEGKGIVLVGTEGSRETILDGDGQGSVVTALRSNLELRGFTIRNGQANSGGGLSMLYTEGTLASLVVEENAAAVSGGGMYLYASGGSLTDITVSANSCSEEGGGLSLEESVPTLSQVVLTENTASDGAGMYLSWSNPHLREVTLYENTASNDGGGMHLANSSPSLIDLTLNSNLSSNSGGGMYLRNSNPTLSQATVGGNFASRGGGLYLNASSPTLHQVDLSGNTATGSGGGMVLSSSSPILEQVIVSGNSAFSGGGGLYLDYSSPTLGQVTVSGNTASGEGGGINLNYSSPQLTNVIVAFNSGVNLFRMNDSSQPTLSHCDLFSPFGASHNLDPLNDTNLMVDPQFVTFSDDGDPTNDDLYLRPNSPLIDAGAPDLDGDGADWQVDEDDRDPDGTRADMGVYAGPEADWSGYADGDGDGIYDGWESANGLDPTQDDGGDDLDGDGATNLQEFEAETDPQGTDSDGDGYSDGAELEAGSDALNPCGIPGVDGLVTLRVPEEYATIQEAVDAVVASCRIEVSPGTYLGTLWIEGKGIVLVGTEGSRETILDGDGQGSVVTALHADLDLQGFTVRNGQAEDGGGLSMGYTEGTLTSLIVEGNAVSNDGGGMYLNGSNMALTDIALSGNAAGVDGGGMNLEYSAPSLSGITLNGNDAARHGGGIYLWGSSPTLNRITLSGNTAGSSGGGMSLGYSDPSLTDVTLSENTANYGAGMFLFQSSPSLADVTLSDNAATHGAGMYLNESSPSLIDVDLSANIAESYGGGMYLEDSSPRLTQVTLNRNAAANEGGGMYLRSSSPTLTQVILSGNGTEEDGGGMYLQQSSPTLTRVMFRRNSASREGGGMYLYESSPALSQVTLAGNTALGQGGGMYLSASSPSLINTILAFNRGADLVQRSRSEPTLSYCDLFSSFGTSHNLIDLNDTNREVDPGFISFSEAGDPADDDLYLRPGSPLLDAGAPDLDGDETPWSSDEDDQDPDGTRADMGVYGGPGADWSGYEDTDSDGLMDRWERANGLDPTQDDGADDPDGDEATNLQELESGTDPQSADSDGDGHRDGVELREGSDPLNFCAQPGIDGLISLRVPSEYATIQEAVDAVVSACRIEVSPGTYVGTLWIEGKGIVLVGTEGSGETILDGNNEGSVVTARYADLSLTGFTVRNGDADTGGGLHLWFAEGTLASMVVVDNTSGDGAGMYLSGATMDMTDLTVRANVAAEDGGGMYLHESSPTLTEVHLLENTASQGGGIYLKHAKPSLEHVIVADNLASDRGGGMYVDSSSPALNQTAILGNIASDAGGGLYLYFSSPSLKQAIVAENTTAGAGGGMWLFGSYPTAKGLTLSGNTAGTYGGGIYLDESSPSLNWMAMVGNRAFYDGGGLYLESSTPAIEHAIVAYNSGRFNVFGGTPIFAYSDIYDPDGDNLYHIGLDESNLTAEPGFLVDPFWDGDLGRWVFTDLHLALDSPLIDAGNPALCTEEVYADCDPDGSRADLGIYGGSHGDAWDRDGDGSYDYFWPGTIDDAPEGFDAQDYDGDDGDEDVSVDRQPGLFNQASKTHNFVLVAGASPP